MELNDFYYGKSFDAYEYFGAHKQNDKFTFRTYAPNASKVTITGDFNGWTEDELIQEQKSGVFIIENIVANYGMLYKYCIYTQDGRRVEHCDPYGFAMELRPAICSIITDLNSYKFNDQKWMKSRDVGYDKAVNIYELHLGSWKKKDQTEEGWFTYSEIADELIDYVKKNNYTHIEFMPLSEHPFDGSWGYQNTGFFAPTSRYGKPDELKELIDKCHAAGIGAIMDFVPVHFAIDAYGLKEYDGTKLYEYPGYDVEESEWGSLNFIHSRREVRCFLQSAANYWLKEFHFDGLRMDAVSRLIYWQGDERRGENGQALEFIKVMNQGLKKLNPTAMLIAEDSSPYKGVTKAVSENGLGFDYKWDLGWMHDTLEYFQTAPEYRSRDYHKITFSMMYFYQERYLLEFSHDEVVHGKATILQKMNGDYDNKFPQARALYLYMLMHSGKKLNFMANEIGQLREWDEKREQDWDILKYPIHQAFHKYMKKLNKIYLQYKALHLDYNQDNFKWLDCDEQKDCIYAIERKSKNEALVAIFNLLDCQKTQYTIELENVNEIKVLLNTDSNEFGGKALKKDTGVKIINNQSKTKIEMDLASFSGVLLLVNYK
jgi:1,4-alpha-glucan branching enzyme